MQHSKDEKIGKLLNEIRVYLPNIHREGGGQTSDYLVHPTALAHLRRRFNYICSTLLRNDSLADMSDRSVLYFELLHWLEVRIWSACPSYRVTLTPASVDHLRSRSPCEYDGYAYHGCRICQGRDGEEVSNSIEFQYSRT